MFKRIIAVVALAVVALVDRAAEVARWGVATGHSRAIAASQQR
jgi:hypothetical protein